MQSKIAIIALIDIKLQPIWLKGRSHTLAERGVMYPDENLNLYVSLSMKTY